MTIQPTESMAITSITAAIPAGQGWGSYFVEDSTCHIVPVNDLLEHTFEDCECGPVVTDTITDKDGGLWWQMNHNAWDGRDFLEKFETPEEEIARIAAWHEQLEGLGVHEDYWGDVVDGETLEIYQKLSANRAAALAAGEEEPEPRTRDLSWTLSMMRSVLSGPDTFRSKASDLSLLARIYLFNGDKDRF